MKRGFILECNMFNDGICSKINIIIVDDRTKLTQRRLTSGDNIHHIRDKTRKR